MTRPTPFSALMRSGEVDRALQRYHARNNCSGAILWKPEVYLNLQNCEPRSTSLRGTEPPSQRLIACVVCLNARHRLRERRAIW